MLPVSREQIDRAKQIDLLDYLKAYEPDNIKRIGNAYYLKDHDSFEISNGLWNWHSQNIGGRNVIDYLIKVRGYNFVDAVCHLTGIGKLPAGAGKRAETVFVQRKPFALPPRNKDNERVIAYLQGRGIAKPLILDCIRRGSLYESARYHNCVFVGRDNNRKARFAALRGTKGDFKRDVEGSDKRFGFLLPPVNGTNDTVAVFESPIDALSHQTLFLDFCGYRLSLGCTALAALTNFLERYGEVKHCVVCTDNDEAGNKAAAAIKELPSISVTRALPPAGSKDWNEALTAKPSLIGRLEQAKTIINKTETEVINNNARPNQRKDSRDFD